MLLIYVVSVRATVHFWLYHLLQVHKVHTCYTAEAAYRFFKTKSEEDSLKRNGMAERKKVTRRRQERVTRVSFAFMLSVVYPRSACVSVCYRLTAAFMG